MRKGAIVRLLAAVLLFTAAEARAAAPMRELPPAVTVHVAVRSPMDTLAAIDGYVANASRGSQHHMPAGSIEMIARLALPFPLDTWESEDPAEIFFVLADGGSGPKPVTVIRVDDFDFFLESLEEKGWAIDDGDEEAETPAEDGAAPSTRNVFMPDGQALVLVRVEGRDNLVAIAEDPAHVALALVGDWRKEPASDADIVVTIANNPDRERYEPKAAAAIARRKNQAVERLTAMGVKAEVAAGIFAALEKYAPRAVAELDRLEGGVCELTVNSESLLLGLGGHFAPDALLGEMTRRLAGGVPVANPLEANIPDGVVSYSLTAPLDSILPDARDRIVALNADVYGMFLPDLAGRVKEVSAAFFDALDGGSAMANFAGRKGRYSVMLLGSREPTAAMKAFRDGVDIFNRAWAESVTDPDHALTLVETEMDKDGASYVMVAPRPANPDKFREFVDTINAASRDTHLELKAAENLRLFLAVRDGVLITAIGELEAEEFLATLAAVSAKAATPMAERAAVKKLRPELSASQATIGFIDADGVFRLALEQMGRDMAAVSEPSYGRAVEKTLANLQKNGSAIGVSLGAAADMLVVHFAVPAAAVNGIVRNYENFLVTRRIEAARQEMGEDEDEEGNDDGDADAEEEEEPEAA